MSRKKLHTKKLRSQKTPETSGVFYDKPDKKKNNAPTVLTI
jgi:hypothetical protein